MKKLAFGIIVLVLMGFAAKELFSSRTVESEPKASGFKYYYYPKLNVYYDATQNNFVYTVDGGITWQTKKPVHKDLPETLGEKVTIYSPDPDAWVYNSQHRQQYKGVMTNYIQRPEDTAQFIAATTPPKTETGQAVQKETADKADSKEKKKGGSWFNRFKEKIKRGFKKNKEPQPDSL